MSCHVSSNQLPLRYITLSRTMDTLCKHTFNAVTYTSQLLCATAPSILFVYFVLCSAATSIPIFLLPGNFYAATQSPFLHPLDVVLVLCYSDRYDDVYTSYLIQPYSFYCCAHNNPVDFVFVIFRCQVRVGTYSTSRIFSFHAQPGRFCPRGLFRMGCMYFFARRRSLCATAQST